VVYSVTSDNYLDLNIEVPCPEFLDLSSYSEFPFDLMTYGVFIYFFERDYGFTGGK
jgi:hypothetical protein